MLDINSNLSAKVGTGEAGAFTYPASHKPSVVMNGVMVDAPPTLAAGMLIAQRVDQTDVVSGKAAPLAGKTPDTVKESMDKIANNGGPRSSMKGQQNSKNYNESGSSFRSTSNASDSDAGN